MNELRQEGDCGSLQEPKDVALCGDRCEDSVNKRSLNIKNVEVAKPLAFNWNSFFGGLIEANIAIVIVVKCVVWKENITKLLSELDG